MGHEILQKGMNYLYTASVKSRQATLLVARKKELEKKYPKELRDYLA